MTSTLDELTKSLKRLRAKYTPTGQPQSGLFLGDGFNVITLVESLKDAFPEILVAHENLSSYVHGGFEEHMSHRKISRHSDLKQEAKLRAIGRQQMEKKAKLSTAPASRTVLSLTSALVHRAYSPFDRAVDI